MDSVDCFNENTGAITTNTSGGTAPYSYSWSNGNNLANPSSLFAGEYSVIISDALGCTYFDTIDVLEPNIFSDYPLITHLLNSVENLPGVSEYLDKRPNLIGIAEEPKLVIKGKVVPTGMTPD